MAGIYTLLYSPQMRAIYDFEYDDYHRDKNCGSIFYMGTREQGHSILYLLRAP